jgi:hypothetical protein
LILSVIVWILNNLLINPQLRYRGFVDDISDYEY